MWTPWAPPSRLTIQTLRRVGFALALALLLACRPQARDGRSSERPAPLAPAALDAGAALDAAVVAPRVLPNVTTDWCGGAWRGLDPGVCYLLPDGDELAASRPLRLLVYLAGIVPPTAESPQKAKVQRIVAAAARRAGVVALLPRGRRGLGPADAKDWWAWPTSVADVATLERPLVREWTAARAKLEAVIGRPFARVYLAGSSSGAYFLAALALRGVIDADGYAATSGGAVSPGMAPAVKPPFYVGYATGDPTSGGPKALAAFLASAGWPVRVGEHSGGHGAREEYLDEAFAFWDAYERDAGR